MMIMAVVGKPLQRKLHIYPPCAIVHHRDHETTSLSVMNSVCSSQQTSKSLGLDAGLSLLANRLKWSLAGSYGRN